MIPALAAITLVLAQPELRPIDAGTEDASANRQSRLVPRVDQRRPIGFDQVFELTKPDGRRVFVRMSGAVYAEFDRSVYTAGGPDVPPGTVFRFGSPTEAAVRVVPSAAPNRVDLSASSEKNAESQRSGVQPTGALAVGEASIIGNELYRRVRVSQLLFGLLKPGASEP